MEESLSKEQHALAAGGTSRAGKAARFFVGRPALIPHTVRVATAGAFSAVRDDPTLGWLASTNEIRRVVPGVVLGAEWGGLDTFLDAFRRVASTSDVALEIGCGGGRVTKHLREAVGTLDATDVSDEILAEARNHTAGLDICFFPVEGFGENFANGRYDLVVSHDVFVHFEFDQAARYFFNVARALRNGGHFLVSLYVLDNDQEKQTYGTFIAEDAAVLGARRVRRFPSSAYDCLFETFGLDIVERTRTPLSEYAGGKPFGHLNYLVRARVPLPWT